MTTIITIDNWDTWLTARWDINTNFSNLNTDKVEVVAWKWLSENDYTTAEKNKLAWIEAWAEVNNISDVNATDLTDWWDTTLHTHNWIYYTETEVNSLLSWKQDTSTINELIEDTIWSKVIAWTNVTVTYNDTTGETTINSTGGWGGWWGGDMLKATYDTTNNGVVDNSEKLNNQSASYYLDRTNHTWTQTASTVSDLNTYTWTVTNKTLDDISNDIWANHIHIKVKNLTWSTINNWVLIKIVWYESWDETVRVAPISSSTDVAIWIMHWNLAHWVVWLAVNTWIATWINTSWLALNTIYYSNWSGWITATKPTSWFYQAVAVALDLKVNWSLLVEFTEPVSTSIVWLTWTKAQFDTAVTDWNITYVWDSVTSLTTNTAKLLWRATAWSWAVEEITLWTWLSFSWTTLNASGWGWGSNPIYRTFIWWEIFTWLVWRYVSKWTQTITWVKIGTSTLPVWSNIRVSITKNSTTTNNVITAWYIELTTTESATNWIYTVTTTTLDVTHKSLLENDILYFNVSQIGSTISGTDLEIICY